MEMEDLFGDLDDIDDDFNFENNTCSPQDTQFDLIVEQLQDIVLQKDFEYLQNDFLTQNCMVFDHDDENKFEYMTLFKTYQTKLDTYLQQELTSRLPVFDMHQFQELLSTRQERIEPQLLDLLFSLSDFESFKNLMLDHKTQILSMSKKKVIKTKASNDNIFKQNMEYDFQKPLQQRQQNAGSIMAQNQNNSGFDILCTPLITRKQN